VLLDDSFIPERWRSFNGLEEEGFVVRNLFDEVGWSNFLENFSV